MDDPRNWAVSYLALRGNVPWRWAEGGEVIVWSDGTTIAFREEIAFVLEWLVPHGWPPFGSLIWLLAATRGKLLPATARHSSVSVHEMADDQAGYLGRLAEMHVAVVSGLGMVARLPAELRTTQRAKAVLAEVVFGESPDEGHRGHKELLSTVVKVLRSGELTDAMLNDPGAALQASSREWLALHDGLNQLGFEALKLRIKTGLDALPRAAEIPEIASVRVRALLEDLRNDPAGAGLSRLARDFMAAVQLPRRLSEHDELPIGGFADLANRGNLDRLLLSELAHDDLTLAVRIALNEALYLRREPPVKQPPSTLAILLDSGVRLWGVPRVMATAVALALLAKSARHETPVVSRAQGSTLVPVDLLSREGLVNHLEVLETDVQPGAALTAFHGLISKEPNAEAVLITHRDALNDPDFCRSLARVEFAMLYLAVVDREGNFELRRHPQGGPPVCQAKMRMDDLASDPPRATPGVSRPLIDREKHPDLPVILSLAPFPLLLSVRGKVVASVAVHRPDGLAKVGGTSGGLCVMQDRRLMRWSYPACGAETLAWGLPRGRTLWLGELDDGRVVVLKVHEASQHVVCQIYRGDGEPLWTHHWRFSEPVRRAELHGDVVFVITLSEAHAYDLAGRVLGKVEVGRANSHGRYFPSSDHTWKVLVWDGLAVRLEPVTLPVPVSQSSILRLFHRQGCEGPWCLTKEGDVY